jgi:hypothetical protein
MRTISKINDWLCVFAGLLLLGTYGAAVNQLWGQGATATILGTVTDPSGAAIPDASLQARNVGTSVAQTVTADAQGRYRVPDLGVGQYEVQASKTGFSTVVHKGITLTVGGQTVVDFSLPVGQAQQTVTVEGQVSQVETTNAAIGTYTSEQQMRELPLNGRNFEQLIQLAPGVNTVQWSNNAMQGRAAQYSVAGGRPEGQAILLDDENLQSFWNNGISSITGSSLGVEAIGEYQALTNAYGAQFGGNGAVINAVSKSGTNSFHGSAFDFLRNSVLDARDFFSTKSSPPAYRRNQYGGSLGGPVKKDKAFFFVDYEGIRQLFEENKLATVPNCPAKCTITATDPVTRQAIANTLAIYPKPDFLIGAAPGVTPTSGQTATFGSQTIHEDYVLARFDYTLSEKDAIFARYFSDKASEVEPFAGAKQAVGGGELPYWIGFDHSHSQYSIMEERHIFSPTLVNVARFSFSRPTRDSAEPNPATAPNGSHPLQFFPVSGLPDGFVNLNSAGLTGLGSATGTGHFVFALNRYTEADDILWTRGAHSIRIGASVSRFQNNSWNPISENAVWTFTSFGCPTNPALVGCFLSGNALTVNGVVPAPGKTAYRDYRQTDIAPYVQDDWRVTSKLTLNLGLRWQFMTNPTERLNRLYAIKDFATATGFSNIPNIFRENPSWKNFGPRIGLAYDPFGDHKTSIRAGFGIFYDPITVQAYQTGFGGAPPWAQSTLNGSLAIYPFAPTKDSPVLPAQTIPWDYRIHTTPYMMQYNFNIQREVARDTVLTLGYVGSHGVHLLTGIEKNPPVPTIDSNGVYHFPSGATFVNGLYVNRVNPHLGNFSPLEPISTSRYNSLQTILNRRFSRSVQAQVAYTWSKCIDDGAFGVGSFNGLGTTPQQVENPFNQAIDRGPCSYDINHVLRVNSVVALPFHGNRLVEGWQISGILSTYTGIPINANTGFDRAQFVSGNTPRPDYAPNNPAITVNGISYPACNNQPILGSFPLWFNPNCFLLEPAGTLGNVGRNTLRGPHFLNTDIALLKDTKLSEQFRLQFRAEFFNIFNHENFAAPNNNIFSGSGAINASAGRITGSNVGATPRQIQFGLKLNF